MDFVFWTALSFSVYTYAIYPVILLILSLTTAGLQFRVRNHNGTDYTPHITFIIAAHNEEKVIEKKIHNTLGLSYPREKMQIIVVSDHSTDATNQIVDKYSHLGVKLINTPGRGGKTLAQNLAVQAAVGEILVFSDANSIWHKFSLKRLVERFADDRAGYVCGQLRYVNTDSDGYSEGLYWKYEMTLRRLESQIYSITAGNGAIYAVRATDYVHIDNLYCHDLELPHNLVAGGKLAIYEPGALAEERAAGSLGEEYLRKRRMLARTWHRILTGPNLYNPFKYGVCFSWMMISHRLLRYIIPFFQISFLISSIFLWKQGVIYQTAVLAQAAFYALAVGGAVFPWQYKLFYLPKYFCMVNLASLAGFVDAATGKVSATWEKAESTRIT